MARRSAPHGGSNVHGPLSGVDLVIRPPKRGRRRAQGVPAQRGRHRSTRSRRWWRNLLRFGAAGLVSSGGAVMGLSMSAYGSSAAPHVMVIMMENKNLTDVVGQSAWPYTNSLISHAGLDTESYSMQPGSLPNYLALVSGSTQGINPDDTPAQDSFPSTPTLADQLVASGYTAKGYAEDLPADPAADSGDYVVRHNPWPYFPNADITVADSSSLIPDLDSASAPDFVWYSPSDTDDGDGGSDQTADTFLSDLIPAVQATPWYSAGGEIVITWDESSDETTGINGTSGGGNIPTIVVSAALAANPEQIATQVDTVGVLHSIEDLYGLPQLGGSSADGSIDALLDAGGTPATTTSSAAPTTAAAPTTTSVSSTTTQAGSTTTTVASTPTTTGATTTTVKATTGATTTTSPKAAGAQASSSGGSGNAPGPGATDAVSAPSSALAFTGSGGGVSTLCILGAGLVLLGFALFALVGAPRRRMSRLAMAVGGGSTLSALSPGPLPLRVQRSDLWLRPPS